MAVPSSGTISIQDLVDEFGGSTPHAMSEYYRGGSEVPNVPANSGIPTSGTLALSDFYGAVDAVFIAATGGTITTSGDFKINIDRTQVIDEESIIVWINDADFMRLYDWLFSIQDRVSLDKTSLTKSSSGRVSAQLNLSKI